MQKENTELKFLILDKKRKMSLIKKFELKLQSLESGEIIPAPIKALAPDEVLIFK